VAPQLSFGLLAALMATIAGFVELIEKASHAVIPDQCSKVQQSSNDAADGGCELQA